MCSHSLPLISTSTNDDMSRTTHESYSFGNTCPEPTGCQQEIYYLSSSFRSTAFNITGTCPVRHLGEFIAKCKDGHNVLPLQWTYTSRNKFNNYNN